MRSISNYIKQYIFLKKLFRKLKQRKGDGCLIERLCIQQQQQQWLKIAPAVALDELSVTIFGANIRCAVYS